MTNSNSFAALSDADSSTSPTTTLTEAELEAVAGDLADRPSPFVGLLNQGATCYLNSLLQGLFMTPELRRGLYELDESDLGIDGTGKARKVPRELVGLFGRLQTSPMKAVGTAGLTQSFGWENKEASVQQDVCELNRLLMDAVERSLKGTKGEKLLGDLYSGLTSMQTRCLVCKNISQRQERFYDITLSVGGFDSLGASLKSYLAEETLSDRNQYLCSKCNKKVDAKRGVHLIELPPVLTFSLLRFTYNWQTNTREKINTSFSFPLVLDGSSLGDIQIGAVTYDLASVVIHRGGAFQGHYHAYVKDFCGEADWSAWIGKTPAPSSSSSSGSSAPKADVKPILSMFYALLQEAPGRKLLVDALMAKFKDKAGISWKDGYKVPHGGIQAFFKRHPKVLVFNEKEQSVQLHPHYSPSKEDLAMCQGDAVIHTHAEEEEKKAKQEEDQDGGGGSEEREEQQQERKLEPKPPLDNSGWFDFDDSTVKAVHVDQLKTAYGGGNSKECAYMLVYRRRPSEPVSVPTLPAYIRHRLEKEQVKRLEEKKNAQLAKEALELNGLWLCPGGGRRALFNITSSVTSTLDELKLAILERLLHWGEWGTGGPEELELHMVKGGSLYVLSGEMTLKDAGVINSSEILAERTSTEAHLEVKEGTRKTRQKDNSLAAAEFNRRKELTRVTVVDCHQGNPQDTAPTIVLYVSSTKRINAIRQEACELLGIHFDSHTRFKNAGSDKLVTDEHRTPSELRIKSSLVLESGPLPSNSEIYLRIAQVFDGVSKKSGETRGLLCGVSQSLREVKKNMKALWEVPETEEAWVRRAGADGKPGLVCYDEEVPLNALECAANSVLYLEMEKLPEPGHIDLRVFLRTSNSGRGRSEGESKAAAGIINPFDLCVDELVDLGEFGLNEKDSVGEFKQQLLTHGFLSHISDFRQLRLSALSEQKAPSRIFKSDSMTLKEGKLKHGDSVLVEALLSEDKIPDKSTLFFVVRRVKQGDDWTYAPLPPIELFLRKDEINDINQLKAKLHSTWFNDIPVEKMIVAYYIRHQYKWKVFNSAFQKDKKKQRKKPALTFDEFKQMGDRTVLAVKLKGEDTDDFRTEFDRVQMTVDSSGPASNRKREEGPALTIDCDFD